MARQNEIVTDVALDVDGGAVKRALDAVSKEIRNIQSQIKEATRLSKESAEQFDQRISRTSQALTASVAQLNQLARLQKGVTPLEMQRNLANSTVRASKFSQTLKDARDAAGAIEARLNNINKKIATGSGLASNRDLSKLAGLEKLKKDLSALDRQFEALEKRGKRTDGGDFSSVRAGVLSARDALTQKLLNPRASNFTAEMQAIDNALLTYERSISQTRAKRLADIRAERQAEQAAAKARVSNFDRMDKRQRDFSKAWDEIEKERLAARKRQEDEMWRGRERQQAAADARQKQEERQGEQLVAARNRLQQNADIEAEKRWQAFQQKQKLSQAEMMRMRRDQMQVEVQDGARSGRLGDMRLQTELRLARLRDARKTATGDDLRMANMAIELEKARLREIEKQIAAKQRENAQQAVSPRGPSILPSGGLGTVLARTAAYGGAAALLYGTIGVLRDGAAEAIKFEDALARLQSISGSTDTQMAVLADEILNVATNSRYATSELIEASTQFAQAGLSAKAIGQALGDAANLASASGSTMAESVDLITSALGSFQLQQNQTGQITDSLVAALNESKLTVQQVALGIQYAGQTAFEQNISFQELTATMGALAQAGIRSGSTIGTGLRQFLVDLQSPSQKLSDELRSLGLTFDDINVKTLGLPEVLRRLSDAGFNSASAYGTLETRAAAAYLVLKNNQDVILQLTEAQAQNGVAARAAAESMDTLAAQWQRFKNSVNEAVAENTKGIQNFFKNLLRDLSDLRERNKAIAELQKQLASGQITMSEFSQRAREIDENLRAAGDAAAYNAETVEEATTSAKDAAAAFEEKQQTLTSLQEAISRVAMREEGLRTNQAALRAETLSLISQFAGLGGQLDLTALSYDKLTAALARYQAQQLQDAASSALITAQENSRVGRAEYTQANQAWRMLQQRRGQFDPQTFALLQQAANAGDLMSFTSANAQLTPRIRQLQRTNPGLAKIAQEFLSSKDTAGRADRQSFQFQTQGQTLGLLGGSLNAQLVRAQNLAKPGATDAQRRSFIKEMEAKAARATNPAERAAYQQIISIAGQSLNAASGLMPPKPDRGGGAAARTQQRQEKSLAAIAFKTADLTLNDALKNTDRPLSEDAFNAGAANVEVALKDWIKARTELMEEEIQSQGYSGAEAANYRKEIKEQIELKQEQIQRALTDGFIRLMDAQLKAAETAYQSAELRGQRAVQVAQGYRARLDRLDMRDGTPDYLRTLADRRVEQEQEAADRARIPALDQLVSAQESVLGQMAVKLNQELEKTGGVANESTETLRLKMAELGNQIAQTRGEAEALKASFAPAQVPVGLGENIRAAIEAYQIQNGLNKTFDQTLFSGLTETIGSLNGAFTDFFSTLTTNPGRVASAFGAMTKAVLASLQAMAAKVLANWVFQQILGFALGAVGGGFSQSGANATVASNSAALDASYVGGSFSLGRFNGGPIGFNSGGHVENGLASRDSVHAMLAKGEYVLRKRAVDSLGKDFVAKLNAQGARALDGLKASPGLKMPRQETSVYVMLPEEKPQLTENDVLVTVQRDMMMGGQTKRLIRHIAQGG